MNWVERCFVLILILPILGLLDDAVGRYSGASGRKVGDRLSPSRLLFPFLRTLALGGCDRFSYRFIIYYAALSAQALRLGDFQLWRSLLLAMPHSALAIGLVLALSAGGVGWRWISVIFEVPIEQQYLFPRDSWGVGAILSLAIKESAFLAAIAIPMTKRLSTSILSSLPDKQG